MNETDTDEQRFFLQAIDVELDCPLYEVGFSVRDVGALINLIGEDLPNISYYDLDLSPATAMTIVDRYNVSFDPAGHAVRMRPACSHDDLPYQTHTRRELLLMLRGVKPLAVFDYPAGRDFSAEKLFHPYVEIGKFVKREYCALRPQGDGKIYRYVLYALPHEQWRIDAYILLRQVVTEEGWSDCLVRMEGELLGYEKWQNDIFIEYMKRVLEERRKEGEK